MAPTLAASSQKNSVNTTTDLVADAMTLQTGDVVVIKAGTWSSAVSPTASAPSATGLTFTQQAAETGGSFNGNMYLWTAVAASALGSTVITLPGPGTASHHAASFEVWRGGALDATPAVGTAFTNSHIAPSWSITTEGNGSVVTWGFYDNDSNAGARTYVGTSTEIAFIDPGGSNGTFLWAYTDEPTAGAQTIGLTAPTSTRFNGAGIEILDGGGSAAPRPAVVAPSLAATQRASW